MTEATHLARARGDERGATLITFALSLVAVITVIALILGGSLGYSAERDSQTASDAAALAATTSLREYQLGSGSSAAVDAVAISVATANGADAADIVCEVVNANYALSASNSDVVGLCNDPAQANPYTWVENANAAGVRIGTSETKGVPFGEVAGKETITGATLAAATVQPLKTGNSPFMLCSSTGSEGHPVKALMDEAPNYINSAAINGQFMLWGEDMKNGDRQCGGNSGSWRGWVDNDDVYSLPGWWQIDTGNKNGHLVPRLLISPQGCGVAAGADISELDGCELAVPLCTYSNNGTGNNLELYCVRFGSFEVSYYEGDAAKGNAPCQRGSDNASKVICGEFLGAATATGGTGSTDQATVNDVVVIKLVE